MSDYSATRSEYLKVMMGNKKDALAPYRPEQLNDLGDTSLDVASLSDDDINTAVEQMTGTQYENTNLFNSLSSEKAKRSEAKKTEEESSGKAWYEHLGDFFSNIGTSITEGVLSVVDDVWDFTIGVAGGIGGGWWGQENDFTDWVSDAMTDDRWIAYATKALTLTDLTNSDMYTSDYWTDWSYEGISEEKNRAYEGQEWLHTGGNFVGKIIPSLVLAYFTGGASLGAQAAAQGGLALASAYGSSASQALNEGASFQGASYYGLAKGTISGAISAATVGIGGSALGQSGGVASKVGDAVSNKVASMTTSKAAEVFASKASEALVQAGFSAAQGFTEAMADPLVKQITYDSDAIVEAYGDNEKVKQTLYNASMAALTSAASSLATSAIREGGARIVEGKDRYYANFYTQKASRAQTALENEIKSLNTAIQNGKEVDMDASLARIDRLSKQVEDLGQKALERWQAFSESNTVETQAETGAFDESGNPVTATEKTAKTPIDSARYRRQVKQFGNLVKRKSLTDLVTRNIEGNASSASAPQITFNGNGGATAYLGNAIVDYQENSDVAVYSDAKNPDLPSFEVKENAIGVPMIALKSPDEIQTVASLMEDSDAKTSLPEIMSLPLGDGTTEVLLSKLETPEQVRNLALLEEKDLHKKNNFEIADLKGGKAIVFSNGRKTAEIQTYRGKFSNFVENYGRVKTPKEEVEERYGKDVSKSSPSLIIEASNAKEGKTYNLTNTAKTINKIEEALQDIVSGDVPEVVLGGEFKTALKDKGELSKDVFTQLNLMKSEDKAAVKKYIEEKLFDAQIKFEGEDGEVENYTLKEVLDTDVDAKQELQTALDKAFNELETSGKTSKYSQLINEYESKVETLVKENANVRARAKVVAETAKRWNSLANKLGINGKASSLKTILAGGSDADVQFVDMMRALVKETKVSSRTGLSTSPKAMNRLVEFAKGYTYEKFGDSYFWDEGVAMALNQILSDAEDHGGKFNINRELTVEEQSHINDLLKSINHKLSDETVKIYEKRIAEAKKGVVLYGATKPKKYGKYIGALPGAWDSAEGLQQYFANTIGKENPVYSKIVDGWTKAKGGKISVLSKYAQLINDILKENGYKPSKGFSFLKKKVEFNGKKVTLDEVAAIYYSAKTKEGVLNGDNLLDAYSEKTKSYSRQFKLEGEESLKTLKGLLTEREFKTIEAISEVILNDEGTRDFVKGFQSKYGYTPAVNKNYFTLSASSLKAELNAGAKSMGQGMLLGQSWGKARERVNYKGTYRVTPFSQVVTNYIQDLAQFLSFSEYNDELRVLMNTKVEYRGGKASFNELMTKNAPNWSSNKEVGGKSWLNYFQLVVTDSKVGDGSGIGAIVSKLTRGAQTAVLGLNPSSIAKQFGSGFTVMGNVGMLTYLKAQKRVPYNLSHYAAVRKFLTNSDNYIDTTDPENAELEPLFALVRDRFDNSGAIKGKMSSNIQDDIIGKVGKVTLAGMGFADEANNVINVWSVAEQLAHDNEGLAFGSIENKCQALKYFVNLLFTTQSNNNEMYVSKGRSGYMGHGMRELFFLFASDSQNKLQQFDSITREFAGAKARAKAYEDIINDLNASPEEKEAAQEAKAHIEKNYNAKTWAKKASGVVAGLVMGGLFVALIDELRERILAKNGKRINDWSDFDWADFFKNSALDSFVNWVPYVSTIANAVENNSDVSIFTADAINDLISAFKEGSTTDKMKNAVIQFGTAFGLPVNNIYKYVKGIIRNASESAYLQSFGWLESISSSAITESYKTAIKRDDVSGAVEILSINYSLYKTGTADRKTLLEVAKLSQKGYSAVARNVPDYITDEDGNKQTLTDDQKSSFSKCYKQANASVAKLITTTSYLKQDDETKAKSIKKIYDLYYEFAKSKSLKSEASSKLGALLTITGGDYDVATAVLLIQENSKLVATNLKTKKEQAVSLVNRQPMTRNQKLLTLYLMGYGVSDESKTALRSYLVGLGMSQEEAKEFLP